MKWLWTAAIASWVVSLSTNPVWFNRIPAIAQSILSPVIVFLPLAFVIVDFFFHMPRAISDDASSRILETLFSSTVTSGEIVGDLRKWAIRTNLRHLQPALVMVAGVFGDLVIMALFMIVFTIPVLALTLAAYHFLLISGLFTAVLPGRPWKAAPVLAFWVFPVLVGVFWGGLALATSTGATFWGWTPRIDPSARPIDFPVFSFGAVYWPPMVMIILLEIATQILAWVIVRLMEMRRRGRWG
jgi:hypothetical protein